MGTLFDELKKTSTDAVIKINQERQHKITLENEAYQKRIEEIVQRLIVKIKDLASKGKRRWYHKISKHENIDRRMELGCYDEADDIYKALKRHYPVNLIKFEFESYLYLNWSQRYDDCDTFYAS